MKKVFALILCLLAADAMGDDVYRKVDAAKDGLVTISNTAGSIDVRGWSSNVVEVKADLGSGVEELVVERDGNEVRVNVKASRSHSNRASSDLVVHVPENSSIKVTGVSTDITIRDVHGAQRVQSISGDIETDAHGADIDIETVSGDIDLEGAGKAARTNVHTVSGDIDAENLRGEIEAATVSGDLVIVDSAFSRVSLNTTSGDMVLHAELLDDGRVDVETINGDVDIEFDGKLSARFDIETFNGTIRNCFGPKPARTSQYAPGYELVFTEGAGRGRVSISTLNGDLKLCKD